MGDILKGEDVRAMTRAEIEYHLSDRLFKFAMDLEKVGEEGRWHQDFPANAVANALINHARYYISNCVLDTPHQETD